MITHGHATLFNQGQLMATKAAVKKKTQKQITSALATLNAVGITWFAYPAQDDKGIMCYDAGAILTGLFPPVLTPAQQRIKQLQEAHKNMGDELEALLLAEAPKKEAK